MEIDGLSSHRCGQPSPSSALKSNEGEAAPKKTVTNSVANLSSITPRLLVIEDDLPLARLLGSWLQSEGIFADLAHDGEEALARVESGAYSLVLLDLNLPKIDGMTLLGRIHAGLPHLPVLVLTGRNRMEDRVLTLNLGADDCLVKPFSLVELLARIRAVLRRGAGTGAIAMPPKIQPGLMLNREEYRVERSGRRIDLTPREFALLEFLMEHAPRPVSRATLMEQVWRVPFDPTTNIVDVYMKYLRDKIDLGTEEKLIRTVRGVGYALACA
jgi:DNA-binding response OmpR family regulator